MMIKQTIKQISNNWWRLVTSRGALLAPSLVPRQIAELLNACLDGLMRFLAGSSNDEHSSDYKFQSSKASLNWFWNKRFACKSQSKWTRQFWHPIGWIAKQSFCNLKSGWISTSDFVWSDNLQFLASIAFQQSANGCEWLSILNLYV